MFEKADRKINEYKKEITQMGRFTPSYQQSPLSLLFYLSLLSTVCSSILILSQPDRFTIFLPVPALICLNIHMIIKKLIEDLTQEKAGQKDL